MEAVLCPSEHAPQHSCARLAGRAALALALLLLLAGILPAYAHTAPRLVRDINMTTEGSDPEEFVALGELTYFAATDVHSGREL
jgi:hypothetical protein